jgi:hypothetical protein
MRVTSFDYQFQWWLIPPSGCFGMATWCALSGYPPFYAGTLVAFGAYFAGWLALQVIDYSHRVAEYSKRAQ